MDEIRVCIGDGVPAARDAADAEVGPAVPSVVEILVDSGMAPSKSEARRLMKSGAVFDRRG